MAYGLYTVVAGGLAQERRLEVLAHNLANVSTVGFKAEVPLFKIIPSPPASFIPGSSPVRPLELSSRVSFVQEAYVTSAGVKADTSPGELRSTGNPLEIAINVKGWFSIQDTMGNSIHAQRKLYPRQPEPTGNARRLARKFTQGRGIGLSTHIQQDLQRSPNQWMTPLRSTQQSQSQNQNSATRSDPAPSSGRYSQTTAAPPMNANGEIAMPVVGRLTSPYGVWSDPLTGETKFHRGIDIASPAGTAIRTALPGTITFSGWKQGYDLTVVISRADGYTTQYSHNNENLVQVGVRVG